METSITGVVASGHASLSGVQAPWSSPRSLSKRACWPADCSMLTTRAADAGLPGAG